MGRPRPMNLECFTFSIPSMVLFLKPCSCLPWCTLISVLVVSIICSNHSSIRTLFETKFQALISLSGTFSFLSLSLPPSLISFFYVSRSFGVLCNKNMIFSCKPYSYSYCRNCRRKTGIYIVQLPYLET